MRVVAVGWIGIGAVLMACPALSDPAADLAAPQGVLSRLLNSSLSFGPFQTRGDHVTRRERMPRDAVDSSFVLAPQPTENHSFVPGPQFRTLLRRSGRVSFVMGSSVTDLGYSVAEPREGEHRLHAGMHVQKNRHIGFYGVSVGQATDDRNQIRGLRGLLQLEFRF